MKSWGRWTLWSVLAATIALSVALTWGCAGAADVEIHGHTEGGLVSGQWELNITVLGHVERAEMTVDDGATMDMERTSPGTYSFIVNTLPLVDGDHVVNVEAFDASNGTDHITIGLVGDNTPPEVAVQWPEVDDVTRSFPVNVTLTDEHANGSMAWVTFTQWAMACENCRHSGRANQRTRPAVGHSVTNTYRAFGVSVGVAY